MFIFEILNCKSSCFSNITGAIDLAFVDRADIKQYIGPPSQPAIYKVDISDISVRVAKMYGLYGFFIL